MFRHPGSRARLAEALGAGKFQTHGSASICPCLDPGQGSACMRLADRKVPANVSGRNHTVHWCTTGAGWLLLQREPGTLSYEQARKFLKMWAAYQVGAEGSQVASGPLWPGMVFPLAAQPPALQNPV